MTCSNPNDVPFSIASLGNLWFLTCPLYYFSLLNCAEPLVKVISNGLVAWFGKSVRNSGVLNQESTL